MATTSTSDSAPWASERVRERRVVAGGAWLTITIIPSNDQFEHRLGPDGSVKTGRVVWPRPWLRTRGREMARTPSYLGHGGRRRPGHPVRSPCEAEPLVSGALGRRLARPGRRRGWRPGPARAAHAGCRGRSRSPPPAGPRRPTGPARVGVAARTALRARRTVGAGRRGGHGPGRSGAWAGSGSVAAPCGSGVRWSRCRLAPDRPADG